MGCDVNLTFSVRRRDVCQCLQKMPFPLEVTESSAGKEKRLKLKLSLCCNTYGKDTVQELICTILHHSAMQTLRPRLISSVNVRRSTNSGKISVIV